MKYEKRECGIKIDLRPSGLNVLRVRIEIGDERHDFFPNSIQCSQFQLLMSSAYVLYWEENDKHRLNWPWVVKPKKVSYERAKDDPSLGPDEVRISSEFFWDNLGHIDGFRLERVAKGYICWDQRKDDKVTIKLNKHYAEDWEYSYEVSGVDLAYAIAKAGTEALKRCGIYGYHFETGDDISPGDFIDINQLLFFKAYALGAKEVRDAAGIRSGEAPVGTPFEKEIELLMFDM